MIAPCLIVAAAALSWTDIALEPSKGDHTFWAWQRSAAVDKPSERTLETLRRRDLERRYRRDPAAVLTLLERSARQAPDPDLVYALAELSWLEGRHHERRRRDGPLRYYLDTVAYAHDFLFDPELARGRQPADPRFQLAFLLYNAALDRLIRAIKANGPIEPGRTVRLRIGDAEQVLKVELHAAWSADDLDDLLLASDFQVTGLPTRTHAYGLGVPLIGVRRADPEAQGEARFFPPEMGFPLTALLRPNSRLHQPGNPGDGAGRECTLMLVDPGKYRAMGEAPNSQAIEADLTTPLAFTWSRTDLRRVAISGLLRPAAGVGEHAGLMLLRPWDPEKIPVVMVHGLVSSPMGWIPMLNDLLNEPRIRDRYQFLLYMYPTGVPLPIAAAGLRADLRSARQQFDPSGRDPAFARMVLLGHSMGGLLSHAMVVSSGDRWWELNTDRPFEKIVGPPEILARLRQYMFFEPVPFVSRVVYLATPHRGSELSRGMIGRVSSSLISEPDDITAMLATLSKANPDQFDRQFRRLPTSIETLEPDSPILTALLEMPPAPGVTFHSIIGSRVATGKANWTDGVVPYRSAHLDGLKSELVVRSEHGVQKSPEAILEVRRILLEHLAAPPAPAPRTANAAR